MSCRIIIGDCLTSLQGLPSESVQCCVTSPPYFGLRDYGHEGQIGLEQTPERFVAKLVLVFREVKRVLRGDGVFWLNLGDSYAANRSYQVTDNKHVDVGNNGGSKVPEGCKPKDLIGIPWMVAFTLRADGWYLRSDIIWAKPNPMPESVTDRPTRSHEYLFLLSKSARYFYDHEAIKEPLKRPDEGKRATPARFGGADKHAEAGKQSRLHSGNEYLGTPNGNRNKRSVWTVSTKPYRGAHFATFPPDLIRPCILAGSRPGDTVIDPFGGSGTTGMVCEQEGRNSILLELNPEYEPLIRERIQQPTKKPKKPRKLNGHAVQAPNQMIMSL